VIKFLIPAGGLGNQLFSWNAAHSLAKNGKDRIFIIYPKANKLGERNNILKPLSQICEHKIKILNSDLIYKLVKTRDRAVAKVPRIAKIVDFFLMIDKLNDPEEIINCSKRSKFLYVGYFQNSEFVLENFAEYLSELRSLEIKTLENLDLRSEIKPFGIGVHIRRGDFVQNAATIGVLSSSYFKPLEHGECLITCESKKDLPTTMQNDRIICGEKFTEWESFFLLSRCEEIWISNSTFSWWAGLYGNNAHGSVVIAPNPWNKTRIYSADYLKIDSWQYKTARFDEI
jgi:hypothetical protein